MNNDIEIIKRFHRYRWGDSTLQAEAVRLFMHPDGIRQIPNISYHHISHSNRVASSYPDAVIAVPQVFPDGNRKWTEDPAMSDLSLVMKGKSPNRNPVDGGESRESPTPVGKGPAHTTAKGKKRLEDIMQGKPVLRKKHVGGKSGKRTSPPDY